MKTINIGILAHVDAGKTSITENILYEANVLKTIGSVDDGNTKTDSMSLERKRGITIKASPVSFSYKNTKINLIDTPGHADFISEVERSLSVLDGAVLIISAVEGIQSQTRVIINSLLKLKLPVIVFINKIDRMGSNYNRIIEEFKKVINKNIILLYESVNEGDNQVTIQNSEYLPNLLDVLSNENEKIIKYYLESKALSKDYLLQEFKQQAQKGCVYPVLLGSAALGIGIKELLDSIIEFFPTNSSVEHKNTTISGVIFKIEIDEYGRKVYFRIFSGSIEIRDMVPIRSRNVESSLKIKKLSKLVDGTIIDSEKVIAGDIGILYDSTLKIGDIIGYPSERTIVPDFSVPNLETSIIPCQKSESNKLFKVLKQMSEEDPLIQMSKDEVTDAINIRIFGDVQKEVIQALLEERHDLKVNFTKSNIIYIEKPQSKGFAIERIGESNNPFCATIGLLVEPNEQNNGINYMVKTEWGALPHSFHKAIEETVLKTLKQGIYGWEVNSINVTLTHADYKSPVSTAGDFRNLTPLVLMKAVEKSIIRVYEPINNFNLQIPKKFLSASISHLIKRKAEIENQESIGDEIIVSGSIPVVESEEFKLIVRNFTEGSGIFTSEPNSYKKMESLSIPFKIRRGINPLNRKEYLLSIFKGLKK